MKRYDLVTVGHMGVDLYFKGDNLTFEKERFQLALGGKYFTDEFHTGVGGGAANVAIGAKKCGLKVGLIAKIGNNPFKKVIERRLTQVQLPTDLCIFENDYLNVSVILTRGRGERTILHYEKSHSHLIKKDTDLTRFTKGAALFMGNLSDVSLLERTKILKYVKAKHITTILNLGGVDCRRPITELKPILEQTDILIQNGHEFSDIIKIPYQKMNFRKNVVEKYAYLKDKIVIVTDSKEGSYGYWEGHTHYMRALEPKKVVDTTGAGDGYTAGFLASYLKSHSVPLAMRRGAFYAGRKLGHLGAN